MRVGAAVSVALALAGCSAGDPDSARAFVGSWEPGERFANVNCGELGLVSSDEGQVMDACFVVREGGDPSRLTEELLDGVLASAGDRGELENPAACTDPNDAGWVSCTGRFAVDGAAVSLGLDYRDEPMMPESPDYDGRYRAWIAVVD